MLHIYQVILDAVEAMQPLVRRIELRDKDLGRQLRRASCSIEMYSRGQNRQLRYHTALGSARETLACLELAQRCRAACGARNAI